MSYRPSTVPQQIDSAWLARELRLISLSLRQTQLDVLHAAPDKPRAGLIVYADGTDWNPGAGEGPYVYKASGWVAL